MFVSNKITTNLYLCNKIEGSYFSNLVHGRPPIFQPTCLFVRSSFHLSSYHSIYSSFRLSVWYLTIPVSLSVYPFVRSSVYLSVRHTLIVLALYHMDIMKFSFCILFLCLLGFFMQIIRLCKDAACWKWKLKKQKTNETQNGLGKWLVHSSFSLNYILIAAFKFSWLEIPFHSNPLISFTATNKRCKLRCTACNYSSNVIYSLHYRR